MPSGPIPHGARILLTPVSEPEHLRHLGVPVLSEDGRVQRIEEKPEVPASNFGVTGIYCYDADVFGVIPTLTPSGRGELEITDVNNHYIEQGQMAYDVLEGFWGDAGESIEAYYAVNDFVRANGANGANGPPASCRRRQPLRSGAGRPELTAGRLARSRRCRSR